ncbi:MAG TPA: hypothetical protein VGM39_06615 [Kofleriaceae bacterium]|jgi:hypothetical protein
MKRFLCLAIVLPACFPVDKPTMGPDGVPTFIGHDFRHAANTPFFCFDHTAPTGTKVSSCHEIQEWCASEMQNVKNEGLVILSGCEAHQEATCLTFYRGDATKTQCLSTPADCNIAYGMFIDPSYGARKDQLTACTTIDQSWQPPA